MVLLLSETVLPVPTSGTICFVGYRSTSARYRHKGIEIRRVHRECHHSGHGVGTLVIRHRQREDMGHGRITGIQRLRRETRHQRSRVKLGATELSPVPPVLAQA